MTVSLKRQSNANEQDQHEAFGTIFARRQRNDSTVIELLACY